MITPPARPDEGTSALEALRRVSPTLRVLEWLFDRMARFSLAKVLLGNSPTTEGLATRRAWLVEAYVFGWCSLEWGMFSVFALAHNDPPAINWVRWILAAIITYRLVDIFQATINIALFDRLRATSKRGTYELASVVRLLVFSATNFVEVGVCFGLLYALVVPSVVSGTTTVRTTTSLVYFSFITQLTVGYGDMAPHGAARLFAVIQAMAGVLFGVLILSRVVSLLPRDRSYTGDSE